MKIYILRKKAIDMYGENPEMWEDISWTRSVDKAIKWKQGSGMYEHKDYISIEESID